MAAPAACARLQANNHRVLLCPDSVGHEDAAAAVPVTGAACRVLSPLLHIPHGGAPSTALHRGGGMIKDTDGVSHVLL